MNDLTCNDIQDFQFYCICILIAPGLWCESLRSNYFKPVNVAISVKDFALFLKDVPDAYPKARKLDLVMDNMNGHFPKSITETFGENEEKKMISRPEFHYTPKHGSWLNIAEIEINVMDMECTKRLFESYNELETSVNTWQKRRARTRQRSNGPSQRKKQIQNFQNTYNIINMS